MAEKQNKSRLKRKKVFFRMGIISLIITTTIGLTCTLALAKEVTLKIDGKETVVQGSVFQNIKELLKSNGIISRDEYSADTNPQAEQVSTIGIKRKSSGNLYVDGKTVSYQTYSDTVGELLIEKNIILGELDRSEPSKETALSDINEIKIIRVEVEKESIRKEVLFKSHTKDNAELKSDEKKVVQPGKNGIAYVVEYILYENNIEVKREAIAEEIITAPIDEIIEIGIKLPEKKSVVVKTPLAEETPAATEIPAAAETPAAVEISAAAETPAVAETPTAAETPSVSETPNSISEAGAKTILNCTAYTATGNATASGVMPQANHTIASWSGLPFGTKIYIPSIGKTYTVEDRGGAVTEGIIDIYMDTYDECIQFGRQYLEAYITD